MQRHSDPKLLAQLSQTAINPFLCCLLSCWLAGWKIGMAKGLILGLRCRSMSVWKWPGTLFKTADVPPILSLLLSWPWDRIAYLNNVTLQCSLVTGGIFKSICPERKWYFYKLPVFIWKILFKKITTITKPQPKNGKRLLRFVQSMTRDTYIIQTCGTLLCFKIITNNMQLLEYLQPAERDKRHSCGSNSLILASSSTLRWSRPVRHCWNIQMGSMREYCKPRKQVRENSVNVSPYMVSSKQRHTAP